MAIALDLFESVFHSVEEHIAVIEQSGTIVACNMAWQNFGIENGVPTDCSWVGQNYLEVLRNSCARGDHSSCEIYQGMMSVLNEDVRCFYYEYPCHSPSKQRWFTMRIIKLNSYATNKFYVISHHDVTQRKLAEERAEALSLEDPLTGLGNRRQFDQCLRQEIRNSLREQTLIGLALIDVDHFKNFNDEFGHAAGDQCLCKIGQVLQTHARRAGDRAMRIGGDEFALLVRINHHQNLTMIAHSIQEDIRDLQMIFSGNQLITVSIGLLSFVANENTDSDSLYQKVDQALYQAKVAGRNQISQSDNISASELMPSMNLAVKRKTLKANKIIRSSRHNFSSLLD